jgi:hypothetical protein
LECIGFEQTGARLAGALCRAKIPPVLYKTFADISIQFIAKPLWMPKWKRYNNILLSSVYHFASLRSGIPMLNDTYIENRAKVSLYNT